MGACQRLTLSSQLAELQNIMYVGLSSSTGYSGKIHGSDIKVLLLFDMIRQRKDGSAFFKAFFSGGKEDILVRNLAQRTPYMDAKA